jgi:hypothetical protein
MNAEGRPVAREVVLAKFVNHEEDFVGLMGNLQAVLPDVSNINILRG